ncbi:NPC intracellular cholesterol transporter 2 homolog a [Calliopsis andreniformis]|uniref:NPC intracellular cholesterol transporter 2 homolog a n=1 Tax=Calliopsis andreniformis TaxID=337506 RepID=UPI003FCD09DA
MHSTIAAIIVLGFLGLCSSPICRAVEITDCGSKIGKFNSVDVKGCDMTKSACDLIRNTNATMEIEFTLDKDVSSIVAVVHGIIFDVPIPFPIPNANVCQDPHSGIQCPLSAGGPYKYSTTIAVLKSYPKVAVTVKYQMKNENNEEIICALIPTKIK